MLRRPLTWIALAVTAMVALGAGLYLGQRTSVWPSVAEPPPDATSLLALALPDAGGREQLLGQWKGKMLIVNFWATWCAPCREEMPQFVKAQQEFGAQGLQFVGIAVDQPDKVRQFAAEINLNYPALIGGYGAIELSRTLGNRVGALPFTVVLDRSGRIVHTHLGPVKQAQLDAYIAQLL